MWIVTATYLKANPEFFSRLYADFIHSSRYENTIPSSEAGYASETTFIGAKTSCRHAVAVQWAIQDGKRELVYVIFAMHGYRGTTMTGSLGIPVADPKFQPNHIEQGEYRIVLGCGGVLINGQRVPLTPRGRVLLLMPDGTVERVVVTQQELDELTPEMYAQSLEQSMIWSRRVWPVLQPLLPPQPVIETHHWRSEHQHYEDQGVYCFAQWKTRDLATPYTIRHHGPNHSFSDEYIRQEYILGNVVFYSDKSHFIDSYTQGENATPRFVAKKRGRIGTRAAVMELLDTGMLINDQWLKPGEIAVIQPDGSYKTAQLTLEERKRILSQWFTEGFRSQEIYQQRIAPLFSVHPAAPPSPRPAG